MDRAQAILVQGLIDKRAAAAVVTVAVRAVIFLRKNRNAPNTIVTGASARF